MRKRLEEDEEVGDSGDLWYRAAAVLYGSCKRIPPSGHLEDDGATEEETERIKLFLVISPHFRSFNFVKCNKTDNNPSYVLNTMKFVIFRVGSQSAPQTFTYKSRNANARQKTQPSSHNKVVGYLDDTDNLYSGTLRSRRRGQIFLRRVKQVVIDGDHQHPSSCQLLYSAYGAETSRNLRSNG